MSRSAHVDRFARDRLPPRERWPDLRLEAAGLAYPERLNAVAELLDVWIARGHAGRPCLIAPDEAQGCDVWSYGRLHQTVNRIARLLVDAQGLVPGNRVLLRGPNTPMLAACWLAVVKAGGIVVPTMPLLRAGELAHILEAAEIRLVLCDAGFTADLAGLPATVLTYNDADNDAGPTGLEARIAAVEPRFDAVDTAAEDIALIAFTSGTTGRPKATAHFHRDLLAVADLSPRRLLHTGPQDVFCGTPPIAFAFGLGGLLLFPLRVGASVVLLDRPSPERLLSAISAHRATLCFTIPTAYRAMTALIEGGQAPAPASLRACVSAGEPLPEATFTAWRAATGLEILDSLGTTEMLNAFLHAEPGAVRPGATGRPVPGYEAMVVDDEFTPLPPGQVGRLAVRGPTGCRYLNDERQAQYVRQGWNLTGDAMRVDEDGVFWYHGRVDDLIVSSGYKISGLEIEEVLLAHPAVEEVAVIATPDGLRGTIPKAFVVVHPSVRQGPDLLRELQDFVKARIAPYKYPRAIEFLEHLPRTETGKIQRYKLRQWDGEL